MGGIIPKAALGRGLGTLMKKPDPAPITLEPGTTQTLLSPGMATLLRGNGSAPNQPGSETEEPEMTQEIPAQTRPNPLDPDELATRRAISVLSHPCRRVIDRPGNLDCSRPKRAVWRGGDAAVLRRDSNGGLAVLPRIVDGMTLAGHSRRAVAAFGQANLAVLNYFPRFKNERIGHARTEAATGTRGSSSHRTYGSFHNRDSRELVPPNLREPS